jgi:hypothetical protein
VAPTRRQTRYQDHKDRVNERRDGVVPHSQMI